MFHYEETRELVPGANLLPSIWGDDSSADDSAHAKKGGHSGKADKIQGSSHSLQGDDALTVGGTDCDDDRSIPAINPFAQDSSPSKKYFDEAAVPSPSSHSVSDHDKASVAATVNFIPAGELSPLQHAIMEAEFGAMQDEIKLLGLNIDLSDIGALLRAAEMPAHEALPLASYIAALCGVPATYASIVEVFKNKPSSILGFIHEVVSFTKTQFKIDWKNVVDLFIYMLPILF